MMMKQTARRRSAEDPATAADVEIEPCMPEQSRAHSATEPIPDGAESVDGVHVLLNAGLPVSIYRKIRDLFLVQSKYSMAHAATFREGLIWKGEWRGGDK